MKPLVSPVLEFRLMGTLQTVAGIAFVAAATLVDEQPVAAFFSALIGAAIFGGLMYPLAYRRFARKAVAGASTLDAAPAREPARATWRRQLLGVTALIAVELGLGLLFSSLPLLAGIVLGNGVAALLVARWLDRWQASHGVRLAREPRYRFSAPGRHGWGRGRGRMDGQDYYLVPGMA